MRYTPHQHRKSEIHFIIILLISLIVFLATACRTPNGCRATRNMSGYGYFKHVESGRVAILSPNGDICIYYDTNKNKTK